MKILNWNIGAYWNLIFGIWNFTLSRLQIKEKNGTEARSIDEPLLVKSFPAWEREDHVRRGQFERVYNLQIDFPFFDLILSNKAFAKDILAR